MLDQLEIAHGCSPAAPVSQWIITADDWSAGAGLVKQLFFIMVCCHRHQKVPGIAIICGHACIDWCAVVKQRVTAMLAGFKPRG